MLNLVIKDFRLHKNLIIIMYVMPLFYMVLGMYKDMDIFMLNLSFLIMLIIPFGAVARDEKFKTALFGCSLPFKRDDIVLGKFLFSWSVLLVGFVLTYSVEAVFSLLFAEDPGAYFIVINFDRILLFITIISFLMLLFYPVALRYGTMTGFIIVIAALNIIGIVAMMLTRVTRIIPAMIEWVGDKYGIIAEEVSSFRYSAGDISFYLLFFIFIIALNFLTYKITTVLYRGRDL